MLAKIICGLILGIVASLFMLQHDPAITAAIGQQCQRLLQEALDCRMHFTIRSINLFTGTIELEQITTQPHNHRNWAWQCNKLIIHISLWELLSHGKLALHLFLADVTSTSAIINDQLAILPHLQYMVIGFSPDLPILLRSIIVHRAQLLCMDELYHHEYRIAWSNTLKCTEDSTKIVIYCTDGTICYAGQQRVDHLHGTLGLDVPYDSSFPWSMQTDIRGHLPQLPQTGSNFFCTGSICNEHGTFIVRSIDDSLRIEPITIELRNQMQKISATASLPLAYLPAFIYNTKPDLALTGTATLSVQYSNEPNQSTLQGMLSGADIIYCNRLLASSADISFTYQHDQWNGTTNWIYNPDYSAHSDWQWNPSTKQLSLTITNSEPIQTGLFPNWHIPVKQIHCKSTINEHGELLGTYHADAIHLKTDASLNLQGTFAIDKSDILLNGSANEHHYQLNLGWHPDMHLKKLMYQNGDGEHLIALTGKMPDYHRFAGYITVPCIQHIIEYFTDRSLQGEGKFDIYGIIDNRNLRFKTCFNDGTIRMPHTYNCIKNIDAMGSIDWNNKHIMLNKLFCNLYEGSISCRHAHAYINESLEPTFLFLPIVLDQCLFNINKDLFATLSGHLLLSKHDQAIPTIGGHIIISRSHLAENIFSGSFHETLSQYTKETALHGRDLQCDITLETRHPIRIKTSFFDTQARAKVQIKGQLFKPEISGAVSLNTGKLLFPYKPLQITKGTLSFSSSNLDDLLIKLVAKNKIKKYLVNLDVTGSLTHHTIDLYSNPPLSKEQIIALLMAGSEEESLSSMAPALIMHNIKSLIFGSDPSFFLQRYALTALQPLRYVHFIPSFSDQSGRGGLRGTLEIDINDRWRAAIQRNFNLFEDTRFELEYLLSDDISLKAIRDEHRDISSEVEMRWKF